MTLCELRFENVFLIGDDEYLDAVAAWFDELFETRWVLDDASRGSAHDGWWRLYLSRDTNSLCPLSQPRPQNLPPAERNCCEPFRRSALCRRSCCVLDIQAFVQLSLGFRVAARSRALT